MNIQKHHYHPAVSQTLMTHSLLPAHLPWAPELHFKPPIALASLWSPSGFSGSKTKVELPALFLNPSLPFTVSSWLSTNRHPHQRRLTLRLGSGQVNVTVIFLKSCLSFGLHSVSSYPGQSQAILYFQCSALELLLLRISHHVLSYTSETILFIFHHRQFTTDCVFDRVKQNKLLVLN